MTDRANNEPLQELKQLLALGNCNSADLIYIAEKVHDAARTLGCAGNAFTHILLGLGQTRGPLHRAEVLVRELLGAQEDPS